MISDIKRQGKRNCLSGGKKMYRVGVDLGGTNIVAGVINEEMKIIGRGKLKTN